MKKTKYRIISEYGFYYPQRKGWFFWHYMYKTEYVRYYFVHLKDAENFVESRRNYKQKSGFEIVKEYD